MYRYMYIYIYIYVYPAAEATVPVSVSKNTPPEKKTRGKISFKNTKSGAGEQFLLQDCKAKACRNVVLVHKTPVVSMI